jgi:hypothetical protein
MNAYFLKTTNLKHFIMKKITLLFLLLGASIGYSQTLIENFEGTAPQFDWSDSDANAVVRVTTNPTVPSEKSLEIITSATGSAWQGAQLITLLGPSLDLSGGNKKVSIDVYSLVATSVLAKVTAGGGPASATDANHSGTGWETLEFNFANGRDNTGSANGIYTNIIFYPLWNNNGNACTNGCYSPYGTPGQSAVQTIYVDNIVKAPADPETCSDGIKNQDETGIDCGGTTSGCAACPAVPAPSTSAPVATTPESDVLFLHSDVYTTPANKVDFIAADWVGAGSNYGTSTETVIFETTDNVRYITDATLLFMNFDETDFSAYKYFHLNVWSDESTSFNLQLVGAGPGNQANTGINIVPNQWNSIEIDLDATFSGLNRSGVFQLTIGSAGSKDYYFDNVYFSKTSFTLGNKNFEIAGLNVYPNPARDSWTVKTQNINMSSIQVFDVLGKNVLSLKPNTSEATINGSSLKAGLYFARINTLNGSSSLKLIKN